jgi:hypothetical protein
MLFLLKGHAWIAPVLTRTLCASTARSAAPFGFNPSPNSKSLVSTHAAASLSPVHSSSWVASSSFRSSCKCLSVSTVTAYTAFLALMCGASTRDFRVTPLWPLASAWRSRWTAPEACCNRSEPIGSDFVKGCTASLPELGSGCLRFLLPGFAKGTTALVEDASLFAG